MVSKELEDFIVNKTLERVPVFDMYDEAQSNFDYNWPLKAFRNLVSKVRNRRKQELIDKGTGDMEYTLKLKKEVQRLRDKVRINEALIRKFGRVTGMIDESFDVIKNKLAKLAPSDFEIYRGLKTRRMSCDRTMIAQLTDLHANEVIINTDTCGLNVFDFKKLSSRLYEYANVIKYHKQDCDTVYVAFTGDLFNSDRRMDELLKSQVTRAEATIILAQILSKFLLHLARDFNVKVVSVLGNESRMNQNVPLGNPFNNFDYLIHKILELLLHKADPYVEFLDVRKPDIEFKDIEKNYEYVLHVYDASILLTHNYHNLTWDAAIKKYNAAGIILDYMITGHKHATNIKDSSAQSGSLVGNNFYGFYGLHSPVKASQNLFLIDKKFSDCKPSINVIRVDLQDVDDTKYYNFKE